MNSIYLFFVLAVIVEGLVEYAKNLITMKDKKAVVLQLSALGASIVLCLLSGTDILAQLGVAMQVPYVGGILTGVFASRGANYASDILNRVNSLSNNQKTEGSNFNS